MHGHVKIKNFKKSSFIIIANHWIINHYI